MSNTTILESYDTQMFDYSGDIDVQMHIASSSSDPWTQVEAKMEDDGTEHHRHSHTTPFSEHESVEVDMESYLGDENPEYEMVDEAQTYHPEGELADVEVYDASQAHSPALAPVAEISLVASDGGFDRTQTSPRYPLTPAPLPSALAVGQEELLSAATDRSGHFFTSPDYPHHVPLTDSPQPLAEAVVFAEPGPKPEPESEAPLESASNRHEVHAPFDSTSVENHTSVGFVDSHEELSRTENHEDLETPEASRGVDPSPQDSSGTDIPTVHTESHGDHAGTVEAPDDGSAGQPQSDYHDEYQQQNGDPEATTDPHEISDGVYIDPPPPVLVFFSSTEHPEFCLFNHPEPNTPPSSTDETQNEQLALTLLLHHRPTLYYEPLSAVFEALRQEECVISLPDCRDGELVLDAFDLHLVIPEDNSYAREITLHDLNVLHDGSDLSGPLRLQLRLVVPRFIIRYHSLRDQITRLNLLTESEDHGEAHHGGEHTHQTESSGHSETIHENDLEHAEETADHEPQDHQELHSEQEAEVLGTYQQDVGDDPQLEESTGELLNLDTENPEYREVHGEEARALEDENEYTELGSGADAETAEADESLDADAVHETADITGIPFEDGHTEYEEYSENHEDDEQVGSTLPATLGGGTSTLDSTDIDDQGVPTDVDQLREPLFGSETPEGPTSPELYEHAQSGVVQESSAGAEPAAGNRHGDESNHGNLEKPQTSEVGQETPYIAESELHQTNVLDESDSNFVAMLERAADQADSLAGSSLTEHVEQYEKVVDDPENDNEQEWDDSLDGEGEIDLAWAADHDAMSNQSSTTLSSVSKTSKRGYDEIEPEDVEEFSPPSSPEPKRARVQ